MFRKFAGLILLVGCFCSLAWSQAVDAEGHASLPVVPGPER